MDPVAYIDAIERESAEFAAALRSGAAAEVSTCPGWRVADLAVHLGVIQRWATEMVRTGATELLRGREQRFAVDPEGPGLVEWFVSGAEELVEVLAACPVERAVWSWVPDSTARFWRRRQAHEATIHRWDAAIATGRVDPIEPTFAADGIEEWLSVFAVARSRASSTRAGQGESFHLHCTDTDGEWTLRFDGPGLEVRTEHTKAGVALRGGASDLLLFCWGRRAAEELEVIGDSSLLRSWSELLPSI